MTPQEKKHLKIGGAILVIATIGYLAFGRKDNGGESNDPTGNGTFPDASTSGFDAKKVANQLWEAMKKSGTDEDTVISILSRVSNSQFPAAEKAFGTLAYNKTTGNQYFFYGQTVTRFPLRVWLKEELSDSEYNNLRRKYPNSL